VWQWLPAVSSQFFLALVSNPTDVSGELLPGWPVHHNPTKEISMNTRKTLLSGLILALLAAIPIAASAAGNASSGAANTMFCTFCHGTDGNITYVSPRLAGQHPAMLTQTLKAYKSGQRLTHPMMNIVSQGLTEQDIADLTAFYSSQRPLGMEKASLYWRLGGIGALTAAVDEVIATSKADPRLAGRLSGACRNKLIDQLCEATGGPCTFTGRDMKSAHTGMHITEAEFGAVAENLIKTLDKFGVPAREKNELVGLIAPMKGDIIGR
jgi:hemoglobin